MEASAANNNMFARPKPLSELLPSLSGILSKEDMVALSVKKQPRTTMINTRTTEKICRPLTFAEMSAEIQVLKTHSPRRMAKNLTSNKKKKGWNSSVKVDKKISHTADGQLKNSTARKVLDFQKPKAVPKTRMTTQINLETPKFQKTELRCKKSYLQAKNSIRFSGICNLPQTPVEVEIHKPIKNRMTIANKENKPYQSSLLKKVLAPPTLKCKKIATPKVDTPLSNSSWKSGSETSFLQKEKEIHEIEEKVAAIVEEQLENIAEVSPPVSTPFKEYRSVQEYFNNSSYVENSALYNDNTIMLFDKPSIYKENDKKEESVIISLCDLLNKATVTNVDVNANDNEDAPTELDNLLEVKKQTENNIKMLETGIEMLTSIKKSQEQSLEKVRKLIVEKQNGRKVSEIYKNNTETKISDNDIDKTLVPVIKEPSLSPEKSPILSRPCSVVKSPRSPIYKIPKKNLSLRKKIIFKSMPNVNAKTSSGRDIDGRALNMYMKMKEQMNFLSTPTLNRDMEVPDTPAVTSHNIQKQLDKLFDS